MAERRKVTARQRLSGPDRRRVIIEAATKVFAERGYASATTALIAAQAGCNETLLFRHFGSKPGMYVASIDAAYHAVEHSIGRAMAAEEDEGLHWRIMGHEFLDITAHHPDHARLWARALSENTGVPEVDEHLRRRLHDVHAYVSAVLERSQRAGGVVAGRRPAAEAWTLIALGWLGIIGRGLGDMVVGEFGEVVRANREWLTGSPE
jgi:AcrR family transcriptional regulator